MPPRTNGSGPQGQAVGQSSERRGTEEHHCRQSSQGRASPGLHDDRVPCGGRIADDNSKLYVWGNSATHAHDSYLNVFGEQGPERKLDRRIGGQS